MHNRRFINLRVALCLLSIKRLVVSIENCSSVKRKFVQKHDPPVLWSGPGSGNTWIRQLIEAGLGVYSGSVYGDESIKTMMPGEDRCDDTVAVIKAHPAHRPFEFLFQTNQSDFIKNDSLICAQYATVDPYCKNRLVRHRATCSNFFFRRAIIVIRHPLRAMLAEYQRLLTYQNKIRRRRQRRNTVNKNEHITAIQDLWTSKDLRKAFFTWAKTKAAREFIMDWQQYNKVYVYGYPLYFIRFEALLENNRSRALKSMLNFIGLSTMHSNLNCAFDQVNTLSTFKRKKTLYGDWPIDIACQVWAIIGELAQALGYEAYRECKSVSSNKKVDKNLIHLARLATSQLYQFDPILPINLNTTATPKITQNKTINTRPQKENTTTSKTTSLKNDTSRPLPDPQHFFSTSTCPRDNPEMLIWIPIQGDYRIAVANCNINAKLTIRHQAAYSIQTFTIVQWQKNASIMNKSIIDIGSKHLLPGWVELSVQSCEKVLLFGKPKLIWNCDKISVFGNAVQIAKSRIMHNRLIITAVEQNKASLAINWAAHLETFGITEYVIGCLDHRCFSFLQSIRAPCFFVKPSSFHSSSFTNSSNYTPTAKLLLTILLILDQLDADILFLDSCIVPIKSMYYTPAYISSSTSILALPIHRRRYRKYCGFLFARGLRGLHQLIFALFDYVHNSILPKGDLWRLLDYAVSRTSTKTLFSISVLSQNSVVLYCDTKFNNSQVTEYGNIFAIQLCGASKIRMHKLFDQSDIQSKLAWAFGLHVNILLARKQWMIATGLYGHRLRSPFAEFLAYLRAHTHNSPSDMLSPRAFGLVGSTMSRQISSVVSVLLIIKDQSQSLLQSQIDAWGSASEVHGFFVDVYIIESSRLVLNFWTRLRPLYATTLLDAVTQADENSWIVLLQPGVILTIELSQWLSRELLLRRTGPYPGFVADAFRVKSPLCASSIAKSSLFKACTSKTIIGITSCESWLSKAILGGDLASGQFVSLKEKYLTVPPWTNQKSQYDFTVPYQTRKAAQKNRAQTFRQHERLNIVSRQLEIWNVKENATLRDMNSILFESLEKNFSSIRWSIHARQVATFAIVRKEQFVGVLSGSVMNLLRIRGARAVRVVEEDCLISEKKPIPDLLSLRDSLFALDKEEEALESLLRVGQRLAIIEPKGGLGNRLRSLSTAMVATARLGLPLIVAWAPDLECEATASDILNIQESGLIVVSRSWPGRIFSKIIISDQVNTSHSFGGNKLVQTQYLSNEHQYVILDDGTAHIYLRTQMHILVSPYTSSIMGYTTVDVRTALHRLVASSTVQSARGIHGQASTNCVSVHIRSQWNESRLMNRYHHKSTHVVAKESNQTYLERDTSVNISQDELHDHIENPYTKRFRTQCSDDRFYTYLTTKHNETASFYLACDHPQCFYTLNKNALAGRFQTLDLSYCRDSSVRSSYCQVLAFADLLNLAHCNKLVVSMHSSFSDTASLLSHGFSHDDDLVFFSTPRDKFVESACAMRKTKRKRTTKQKGSSSISLNSIIKPEVNYTQDLRRVKANMTQQAFDNNTHHTTSTLPAQ